MKHFRLPASWNWNPVPSQLFIGESYKMQKSREGHRLALCVYIKTVHWHGREIRAARPFKGRRLAHGAFVWRNTVSKTWHRSQFFPNQVQFHIKFSLFHKYSFTRKSSFLICWWIQIDKQWCCQCLPRYYILMLTVPYYGFKMER
jgi:hypothetical protein